MIDANPRATKLGRYLPEKSMSWAKLVRENRKARGYNRRELAKVAFVDPSLITLIERDGHVPRRNVIESLAAALIVDCDLALLVAGYAPASIAKHAERFLSTRQMMDLPHDLQSIVHKLHVAPRKVRDKAAAYIDGLLADLL